PVTRSRTSRGEGDDGGSIPVPEREAPPVPRADQPRPSDQITVAAKSVKPPVAETWSADREASSVARPNPFPVRHRRREDPPPAVPGHPTPAREPAPGPATTATTSRIRQAE